MKVNKTLCLTIILLFVDIAHSIPWPVADQDSVHAANKTYGDWNGMQVIPDTTMGFHGGIDIPADSGDPVYAVINGVVSEFRIGTGSDTGLINIAIDTLNSLAWSYHHVHYNTALQKGDSVHTGDSLGCVATFQGFSNNNHLHFQRSDNDYSEITGYLNPLDSLSPSPAQVPHVDPRSGIPNHLYRIFYVSDGTEDTTNYYETTYLRDSIDILVKAHTEVELDPRCGVYAIGYGAEPVKTGGDISFRKMFEMRDTIREADSLQYYLTYANPDTGSGDTLSGHFYNWYIVTNCGDSLPQDSSGLFNIQENCWWTSSNTAGTANADSIEEAQFPDGYYVTTIKVWSHSADSAVALDTILVDNFNPKIKETKPKEGFNFVPTLQKELWFVFSEAMDTTSFTATNIKIQSLKSDSFNYTITNLTYIDSIYRLHIEVDSFRFMDTVQVRFYDEVTDLAGKSVEDTSGQGNISYILTFVVGLMQLTDNDVDDIQPDVYHGNIVWTHDSTGNGQGEIMFYEFYNDTTYQISPGGGIHNSPVIYEDEVAWIGYGWGSTNPVYYYDSSTTQQIAPANRGRYSMEISEEGIIWRAYLWHQGSYDTIWVEYYNPDTGNVATLDTFIDYDGRNNGRADIDGGELVWEHNDYVPSPLSNEHEIYYYTDTVANLSADPDTNDWTPDISNGQIAWSKGSWGGSTWGSLWFYDGANKREIETTNEPIQYPYLHNGTIIWFDEPTVFTKRLAMYDGRDETTLMTRDKDAVFYPFNSPCVHNNQVAWTRFVYRYYQDPYWYGCYNASFYDGDTILHLTEDTLGAGDTYRIEVHDGFVVFDAWDGNDYEIYLYVGDTLNTPPSIVQNLQNEIIDAKANDKDVKLTWSQNSESDLAGYKVYRSDTAYQYGTTPYATVTVPDTTYTDTVPMDGNNHYVVTAYDNAANESGFSNQTTAFIDVFPPCAPYLAEIKKAGNDSDVVLTWDKITTDTLGNQEAMDYYVVYRNTSPSFVPGIADSIGYVSHPDTTYTDSGVLDSSDCYYYLVKAVDSTDNRSEKLNMGYKFSKFVNENFGPTSDRNWVSLPWHNDYSTVSDLTDDLSPSGDPLIEINNLRDDQLYENYTYIFPLGWLGTNFSIVSGRGYEIIAASDDTVMLVGANNPDGLVVLNENSGEEEEQEVSDRNWVSIPYNAVYNDVSDITTEYSPSGDPLIEVNNLRDDQLYENYTYIPGFGWLGTNFSIEDGRAYEFIVDTDTTWDPTEYTNRSTDRTIPVKRMPEQSALKSYCGIYSESDRSPSWILENGDYMPVSLKSDDLSTQSTPILQIRDGLKKRRISHVVHARLNPKDFERLVFTAYRSNNPLDNVTEKTIGSGFAINDSLATMWFNVGNFYTHWENAQDIILSVEALINDKTYFAAVEFTLNKKVDVQYLGEITLIPIPMPRLNNEFSSVHWQDPLNDYVVGYSIYQDDRRLNDHLITETEYPVKGKANIKLVIEGGFETELVPQGSESVPTKTLPIFYAFNVFPNPFFKKTRIDYALPEQTSVEITIYDVSGRLVKTLVSEILEPAYYQIHWAGDDDYDRKVASGIYFIKMNTEEYKSHRKLIFMH